MHLLSNSLLSAVTELRSFDLWCETVFFFFFLIARFWWRNVMTRRVAAPVMQQDWWGFGVGDKTMNTVLVGIPVLEQQDLQINLKKNQQEPNKKCTFQPSFHDSDSLCWVPPRTCTFSPIQALLMQVVHGPQFEKHCSRSSDTGTNLEETIHKRPYTRELSFLYFNINFASLNLAH